MRNEKVIDVNFKKEAFKRGVEEKVNKAKNTVNHAIGKTIYWIGMNPVQAVGLLSGAGLVLTKVAKIYATNAEDRRRATDLYDPRVGVHNTSKRPLRPAEKVEVIERYKKGESYDKILFEMGLLKK